MKQKKEYEWHGLERFHVIREIDLFRHLVENSLIFAPFRPL